MKHVILLTSCLLFAHIIYAQTIADTTTSKSVLVQANFPGGVQAWASYLQHNLRAEVGAENLKVKKHQTVRQTVIVSFLVNKEGKVSEVTVDNLNQVHPKLAAEAARVIKEGPDWVPASQNGHPVIYRQKQSITFAVSAE